MCVCGPLQCGAMRGMSAYLAEPDVQRALHVKPNPNGMNYSRTAEDLRPLYMRLVQKYRMVIYSGDVDDCVPGIASEEWTRELGFDVEDPWRPWLAPTTDQPHDGSLKAGYVIRYITNKGDAGSDPHYFHYMTISGAGHLVPQHRPPEAYTMLMRFLKDEKF